MRIKRKGALGANQTDTQQIASTLPENVQDKLLLPYGNQLLRIKRKGTLGANHTDAIQNAPNIYRSFTISVWSFLQAAALYVL